jgi:DNA-binding SARP family transcriptional activator
LSTHVLVDLDAIRERANSLLRESPSLAVSDVACADLGSDLLPEWDDDWVLAERERFRQLRLHALEALCQRLLAVGRYGEALNAGLTAVVADPLRESAHQLVIQAHLAEGNRVEALRHYTSYTQLLRDELGIEPSRDLDAMWSATA